MGVRQCCRVLERRNFLSSLMALPFLNRLKLAKPFARFRPKLISANVAQLQFRILQRKMVVAKEFNRVYFEARKDLDFAGGDVWPGDVIQIRARAKEAQIAQTGAG